MQDNRLLTPQEIRTVSLALLEQQERQASVDRIVSLTKCNVELQSAYGLTNQQAWCVVHSFPSVQIHYDFLVNLAKVESKVKRDMNSETDRVI